MKKCAICKSMATRHYFGWGEVWLHHRCVDRAHQASRRIQEAGVMEMTPGDNPATRAVVVAEGSEEAHERPLIEICKHGYAGRCWFCEKEDSDAQ